MIETVDGVEPALKRLVQIMKRRFTLLKAVKAKNLEDYNARVGPESQFARVLVVIDEMNTFVGLGALTEEIHNLIMLLVSQGRAVGGQCDRLYTVPRGRCCPDADQRQYERSALRVDADDHRFNGGD